MSEAEPSVGPSGPSERGTQHQSRVPEKPSLDGIEERVHARWDDEVAFEALFRRLGLSVDWSYLYKTIEDRAIRVAQRAFLRNLARGEAYQQEAPTLWDVDFRTAVA